MISFSNTSPLRAAKRQWRQRLFSLLIMLLVLSAGRLTAENYTLGSEEEKADSYPIPYGNESNGAHHQMLVRASELTSLGATAGYLTSLGFDVATTNDVGELENFTIKIKQTTATDVVNVFDFNNWTTVYTNSSQSVEDGWNTHEFSTSFYWDGSSNILVDVCFSSESFSSNAVMFRSSTPFNSVVYFHDDAADVCSNTEVTDVSSMRPDMEFGIEAPMTYSYSDVRHTTTDVVTPGTEKAHMLRIEIFTSGTYDPLKVDNLLFSTLGTTDAVDIRSASVYYTGKDEKFNTDNQFGKSVDSPSGLFAVSGDQELSPGPNFFWLVYDISDPAGLTNVVDASLQSLMINNSVKSPTNSALDGARMIWPYCASNADSDKDTYISEFSIGDMTNTSPDRESKDGASYSNYTDMKPATILLSHEYPISITKRSVDANNDAFASVFIDWNHDGKFDDDERVFTAKAAGGESEELPATYSGSVVVPYSAVLGQTGMRVVLQDKGDDHSAPCGTYDIGETEDYVIVIAQPAELNIVGRTDFGSVGSERRMSVELINISPVESLALGPWMLTGTGAESFRVYTAGTDKDFPMSSIIGPDESVKVDIVFGGDYTSEGQQEADFIIDNSGLNAHSSLHFKGYYASLLASDNGKNLVDPSAEFNVGIAESSDEFGPTMSSRWFTLRSNSVPMQAPVLIEDYKVTGPDAALFHVSTLPYGVGDYDALISISLNGAGAEAGVKHATLTIEHSGANGSPISINLTGRVGRSLLQAPSYVNLQPVALGSTYATSYQNITLIPLTQKGNAPVEITGNPMLTGSGASMMEILGNTGGYYIRGQYNEEGLVVPAFGLEFENTWRSPSVGQPVVVSDAQPWLIAVRMKSPALTDITGSYSADIVFSDGAGNGIANTLNEVSIQLSGEIVKDVNLLAFSPVQLAFGTVPLGSASNRTLTLRNQSGVAGSVVLSITGSDFSFIDGAKSMMVELPAGNDPVNVEVRFAPVNTGSINGVLNISGVIEASVPMNGAGQTASPDNLQILVNGQPLVGTLDFNNVAVGKVMTKTVTIVNNNPGPVIISSIGRSGVNATQFAVGEVSAMTVPGNGGTVSFPLKFVPTSVSSPEKNATITIYNNSGGSRTINVRGTAVTSGGATVSIQVAPASYNYGNQTGTYEFTVMNNGSQAITISGALIIGSSNFTIVDDMSSFPRTVSAGGTTTISVHFNAALGVNGLRSASLLLITPEVTPYPTVSLIGRVGIAIVGPGSDVQSSVGTAQAGLVNLVGNFPNPFSGETSVRFTLVEDATVTLHLYNAAGVEVQTLRLGTMGAGERSVSLSAQALLSGTYHYTVEAGNSRVHGVMVVVK